MLHLRTLGEIGLVRTSEGGTPELLLGPGKPLAFLTYLALSPGHTSTREHLTDLFWADAEPEAARRSLRQVVYRLRRLVGEEGLVSRGDQLALEADLHPDCVEFAAAVAAGDARRIADLYKGPFFASFAAPGGALFEQWADLERQRLHAAYVRALEALVRQALADRRFRDAVRTALHLRNTAPDQERMWRLLIESHTAAGDWLNAAAEAESLERWAEGEGRTVEPATLAVVRAALRSPESGAVRPEGRLVAEMVGRTSEFAAIVSAWAQARTGRLRHVHVTGMPGIGKTRLLADAAVRIAALGGRCVTLRANQGEREMPYAVAGDLARALAALPGAAGVAPETAAVLVGLDPSLSSRYQVARAAPGHDARDTLRLRSLALTELLACVADEQPVAVFVDDLHWVDAESGRILAAVVPRAESCRTLLVTSARPRPGGPDLGRLGDVLALRPLAPEEVGAAVESLATLPDKLRDAGFVAALHEASDGSPLLVLETLQLALEREWLSRQGDHWVVHDEPALFRSLRTGGALGARIASLDRQERTTATLLAVAGAPVPGEVLREAAQELAASSEPALLALERRGHAVPVGEAWELAHDVIAEKVLSGAGSAEVRAAHVALGRALAQAAGAEPAGLVRAARHLVLGGDERDAARLFRAWAGLARRSRDRRAAPELAREFLGDLATSDSVATFVVALPLALQLSARGRLARIGVAAAVVLAALGWGATAWLGEPVRLAISEQPAGLGASGLSPALTAEVLDRLGRRAEHATNPVTVEAVDARSGAPLTPVRLVVEPEQGSVRLAKWNIRPLTRPVALYARLRLSSPGLLGATTDSIPLDAAASSRLWLAGGRLAGQALGPRSRTVSVAAGQEFAGAVNLGYSSGWTQAVVMFVAVPTWGVREGAFFAPFPLATPTRSGVHSVPVRLTAPRRPGRYHLIFAFAAETEPDFVASATNWPLGRACWRDGNDVADWTAEQIDEADTAGQTTTWWQYGFANQDDSALRSALAAGTARLALGGARCRGPRALYVRTRTPATAIEIVVR